jgi:hypothetical protein
VGIEVKSGRTRDARSSLAQFAERFRQTRTLLVGDDGIPLEDFLLQPIGRWVDR